MTISALDEESCEDHHDISGRLPQEGHVKANRPQIDDKLNELKDCFALLNKFEYLKDLEMQGKDIIPKTTQPPKHTITDHPGEINQSNNRQKDK